MKLVYVSLMAALLASGCKTGSSKSPHEEIEGFRNNQELNLACDEKEMSLDPRLTASLEAANISRMLFEGLTYMDQNGKIFPGVAKNISIAKDLKSYTFELRDTKWSNGDAVKASDFEFAWKSMLNPELKAPLAYMLFPIQGAKAAFDGKLNHDEIGIHAINDKTLVINLEFPTPYFLQLVATQAYFPVHPEATVASSKLVSNGPFAVDIFVAGQKLELIKNTYYWGAANVKLQKAIISFMDAPAATDAFLNGKIDWVGAPLAALGSDGVKALAGKNEVQTAPACGTSFVRLNTLNSLFANAKIRQAFMLSCDQKGLISKVLHGHEEVATGLVPSDLGLKAEDIAYDPAKASVKFEEGLLDLVITRNDLPALSLSYLASDRVQKVAEFLVQNWKTALNIDIALEPLDAKAFYNKLFAGNYQLALGAWMADYYDPMSFLSVFQSKDNGINCTGWQNPTYTALLAQSDLEVDAAKRLALLQKAQDLLMTDLPILPLFHFAFMYGKNPHLEHATLSPMGAVDFEDAYFVEAPSK